MRNALVSGLVILLLAACARGAERGITDDPPRLDGATGQYTLLSPVRTARLTPFRTADGETIDLGHFRGKVVLLNFWASWCPPCVEEMPALDRLAARADDRLAIVPVALDREGLAPVARFYEAHGIRHLPIYLDPEQRTAYATAGNPNGAEFPLYGLPITYLLDHRGRVMGYITGAVAWDSLPAQALLDHYLRRIDG